MTKTGFQSCCGFPLGMNSLYAMILGVSSALLSLSASGGCYFVAVDFRFLNNSPDEFDNQGGMTMGLLSYEDTTSDSELRCVSYSASQAEAFDGFFMASRMFGIAANVLIGISALLLICLSCVVVKPWVITGLSAALILGGVCEGFTFLVFLSDFSCKDCRFYFGSALALLCSAVTIINGVIVCHIPTDTIQTLDDTDEDNEEPFDDNNNIKQKKKKRSSTPRMSGSRTSSSDDLIAPENLKAYNKEVVLVLPDGRKQIIEPVMNQPCCGAGFNVFPTCTS